MQMYGCQRRAVLENGLLVCPRVVEFPEETIHAAGSSKAGAITWQAQSGIYVTFSISGSAMAARNDEKLEVLSGFQGFFICLHKRLTISAASWLIQSTGKTT